MTEDEMTTVLENMLQIQNNNDYNFDLLQAQIDRLDKRISLLDELSEMLRLPKSENKNRQSFEQIN
jgi:hypothetical protein